MNQKLKTPKEAEFSHSVVVSYDDIQWFSGWDYWLMSQQTCISYALISFCSVSGGGQASPEYRKGNNQIMTSDPWENGWRRRYSMLLSSEGNSRCNQVRGTQALLEARYLDAKGSWRLYMSRYKSRMAKSQFCRLKHGKMSCIMNTKYNVRYVRWIALGKLFLAQFCSRPVASTELLANRLPER